VAGTFLIVYFIVNIFYDLLAGDNPRDLTLSQLAEGVSKEYTWALRLTINCIGYSALVIPGVLIFKYTKKTKYLERAGESSPSFSPRLISFPVNFQNTTSYTPSSRAVSVIMNGWMLQDKLHKPNPSTKQSRENAFC
jgi:hypothetical protein